VIQEICFREFVGLKLTDRGVTIIPTSLSLKRLESFILGKNCRAFDPSRCEMYHPLGCPQREIMRKVWRGREFIGFGFGFVSRKFVGCRIDCRKDPGTHTLVSSPMRFFFILVLACLWWVENIDHLISRKFYDRTEKQLTIYIP